MLCHLRLCLYFYLHRQQLGAVHRRLCVCDPAQMLAESKRSTQNGTATARTLDVRREGRARHARVSPLFAARFCSAENRCAW